jgi:hypothetical protein
MDRIKKHWFDFSSLKPQYGGNLKSFNYSSHREDKGENMK